MPGVRELWKALSSCYADQLRAPQVADFASLESGGRVKEITFSNNSTSAHIADMLKHNFHQLNTDEKISR